MSDHADPLDRAQEVLIILRNVLASDFARAVEARLRHAPDEVINALYLLTHTDAGLGDSVDVWTAVLMPAIEKEADLRRDISMVPRLGPILAPELCRNDEVPF